MKGTVEPSPRGASSPSLVARVVTGLAICACHGAPSAPAPPSASAPYAAPSASVAATKEAPVDLASLGRDPLWVRAAASRDPVDLATLGRHAGASALVAALADPAMRPVALGALPFARDADLAFAPLAASARRTGAGDAAFDLLDTLARITEEPAELGELLDPEGVHAAVTDLAALAKDAGRPERERALAITVLGRLADRGFVPRADIPSL